MRLPTFFIWLVVAALPGSVTAAPARQPNIVLILADDFGVGDIQASYPNNKIPTPALDRLVRQGMSFTDAHSPSAVCTPSRYGLLTGRYAWRTRLQEWVIAVYEPPLIDASRTTLPGFLQQQGYHTACIGKWHLGWEWPGPQPSQMTEQQNSQKLLAWDFTQPLRSGPTQRGFNYYFGPDVPNFPPFTFIENDRVVIQPTARYQVEASQGVTLPRNFEGSPMAPGWQFDAILSEITRRASRQIRELAKDGKPFFLYFALTSPHEPVSPSKDFRGRSGIAPIADFVMETDWSVGEVLKAIDESGIGPDTLVIFAADNGHSHYTGWDHLIAAGHKPSGPYRGHKGDIWEGGHRVPLILRWPGRVAENTTNSQLVCLTDAFATVAELVGTGLPAAGAEDSFSFLSSALGQEPPSAQRTTLINHSNFGEFAFRDGPWKLVFRNQAALAASRGKPRVAELYNLETDIAEKRDVYAEHPEIARRMRQALEQLITQGASRPLSGAANDTTVRFDITQTKRWAPALRADQGPGTRD
ncbi:MAG: arylsulfatase [Opitutaceae bacterium]|nr:arylsulfatase [Opitutaceae bacterium]